MKNPDHVEFNRLTAQGIQPLDALAILEGTLCEADVLYENRYNARKRSWSSNPANLTNFYAPVWYQHHFHFKYTWDDQEDAPAYTQLMVIDDVDPQRLRQHLHPSTALPLTQNPFARSKSSGVAYRWSQGLGVSPTYILPYKGHLAIGQGFHRFYLALHYKVTAIPILVDRSSVPTITNLLI